LEGHTDLLKILFLLLFVGLALWLVLMLGAWVWIVLRIAAPLVLGIAGAVLLWRAGHDNLGVIAAALGIVGEVILLRRLPGSGDSGPSWYEGKAKIYDKDGNVTGYHDRQ